MLRSYHEVIPNRLYFCSQRRSREPTPDAGVSAIFVNTDSELCYEGFFADFGPPNLSHVHRYLTLLDQKLSEAPAPKIVVHWTTFDPKKRTNCCFLLGCYLLCRLGRTLEEACAPFRSLPPGFLATYRDASVGPADFHLSLEDSLKGFHRALSLGLFDPKSFDLSAYEHLEKVENGDVNWVVPGKLLAFAGPRSSKMGLEGGNRGTTWTPEDYAQIFKGWGVSGVVRLNRGVYEAARFVRAGIEHFDVFFEDGGVPSAQQVRRFLRIVAESPGAVAVHCRAGIGRTGTMVCTWLMWRHGFSAHEAIAWTRVCRPGSVIGPQQQFLVKLQRTLHSLMASTPVAHLAAPGDFGDLEVLEESQEEPVAESERTDDEDASTTTTTTTTATASTAGKKGHRRQHRGSQSSQPQQAVSPSGDCLVIRKLEHQQGGQCRTPKPPTPIAERTRSHSRALDFPSEPSGRNHSRSLSSPPTPPRGPSSQAARPLTPLAASDSPSCGTRRRTVSSLTGTNLPHTVISAPVGRSGKGPGTPPERPSIAVLSRKPPRTPSRTPTVHKASGTSLPQERTRRKAKRTDLV